MGIAKYQHFESEVIHRSQIVNAPYNPRVMNDEARKRLKKGLRRFGLVGSLTWNRRTGNLVSGHQRLSIMDELERTQDYELTVSVIDVSEKEEMEINVQMNNASMMGEFDIDGLVNIVDLGADIDALGFSESDIDIMFGDSELVTMFEDSKKTEETKETLRNIKKDRHEYVERAKVDNDASYYFIVVCESADERAQIFKNMGVPFSEEFVSSQMLKRLKTAKD